MLRKEVGMLSCYGIRLRYSTIGLQVPWRRGRVDEGRADPMGNIVAGQAQTYALTYLPSSAGNSPIVFVFYITASLGITTNLRTGMVRNWLRLLCAFLYHVFEHKHSELLLVFLSILFLFLLAPNNTLEFISGVTSISSTGLEPGAPRQSGFQGGTLI